MSLRVHGHVWSGGDETYLRFTDGMSCFGSYFLQDDVMFGRCNEATKFALRDVKMDTAGYIEFSYRAY